ncbi:D-alanine--poly(phosphoribitol) ligase subunit DltA [Lacticaseibacillus mingshuiensis]|uniref:D-alanine--D-alanyl carrier protein ligase n=1 Tax=Lacticaseibacillus mingshuiensis TaxID=2799574 RepID=A0ABW4CGH3_9LACO|nr:D-alanine--poly(phosphoribitol) ligase subunit DltA [Lacticaseibacillus mingshuiensis]
MIKNIIDTIDSIAQADPDRPAYNVLGEINTYGELKQASDGVAATLAEKNIPAGPIMIYCDQSFATIAAMLGAVKSGHAYIPVDTHSPNDRLAMIEEIAQPVYVLALADLPIAMHTPVMTPAEVTAAIASGKQAANLQPVQGDENFYILFTSGTTGQPKGVQISHRNLVSFVNWMHTFDLPMHPKMLSQAPYSFDLSVMDLYVGLAAGGCIEVMPKSVTDNLMQLFATLPRLDLQVWVSTPSFLDIALLEPTFDAAHYPDLEMILLCGEELTHATAAKVLERFPEIRLYNTYGPTETTVAVSAVQITQQVLADHARLPIGIMQPEDAVSLKDAREQDGHQVGELVISGESVSKGYINRPEKTAAVFSTAVDGTQSYATGDLGYIDDDGMIFYLGRTDFQIKLNGFRIELEEVNHFLSDAPMIRQGVAVPKYNADHKVAQLLAFVVPEANDYESNLALTKAIKSYLGGVMMPYMIPQRFIYRDSLPQTQNNKVAIKALIAEVNDQ